MKKSSKPSAKKTSSKKTFNATRYESAKRKVYGMDKKEERMEERGKA